MTITPLPLTPAVPAPGSAGAPTGQPGSAEAALFGLLVGQHLEAATVAVPLVPTVATLAAQPAVPSAAESPAPVPSVAPHTLVTPTPPAGTADVSTTGPRTVGDLETDADEPDVPDVPADGSTPAADPVPALTPGLAGFPLVAAPAASAVSLPVPVPAAPTTDEAGESRPAPATDAVPATAPPTLAPTAPPTAVRADAATSQPAALVPPAPADGTTAGLAGLNPVVGTTAPSTPATPSATASAVLDQVLPAVPRIVVRGDGTTRLTLKLHPADLGEVHLTVSVRGKEVDVTLAAGAQAREALSEGSSRLRSLLEGIGHTTGQVVLRDLPSAAPAPSGSPPGGQGLGQPTGQSTGQSAGQGDGRADHPGHHRPDGPQHDGSRQDADASSLLRPTGTVRQQPSAAAGLDVTI